VHELAELEKRQEFLSTQIADILDAKKQLEELIEKINEDSRQRFIDTFEAVRKEFHEIFRKLFGGGKADIILETPEDVLESGIDILARPPGKELQSISLLSGGEKALTAIALVLAVFKSKPSPFCVLDEVDAPLDEANTGRFAAIIQEFLTHSQFIVITHNKRMMAVANLLYGITMQEQGVSKRVAVRFDGKTQMDPAKMEPVASEASEAA
ncbi:Chromosome segregation protein SMC, partial [mine drainage metagenome]